MSSVGRDCAYELEDLIAKVCDAEILAPRPRPVARWTCRSTAFGRGLVGKSLRRTIGTHAPLELPLTAGPNILLIIGISGSALHQLAAVPQWRRRFDVVAAFIFDAFVFEAFPAWANRIDHLFVPMPEVIDELRRRLSIPVSPMHFGADVLTHGSDGEDRPIDLTSYGRIPAQLHRLLCDAYNGPGSGHVYFRSVARAPVVYPEAQHDMRVDRSDRMLLFKMLRRSKLCLAFDTLVPGMRSFPHSFVTMRYFEAGGCGAAIVGRRPTTPVCDELLDWRDSTIELPRDTSHIVPFLQELQADGHRLRSIRRRNYVEHLRRHDWRVRVRSMLDVLGIPLPSALAADLTRIESIVAQKQKHATT